MPAKNTATVPMCLTDSTSLYYPQGCGLVRTIGLGSLAGCDGSADAYARQTKRAGLGSVVLASAAATRFRAVDPACPPRHWPGAAEDFADALEAWLDWCDEQVEAADMAEAA